MEITLEAVDQVRERTGVSYSEAKEALVFYQYKRGKYTIDIYYCDDCIYWPTNI